MHIIIKVHSSPNDSNGTITIVLIHISNGENERENKNIRRSVAAARSHFFPFYFTKFQHSECVYISNKPIFFECVCRWQRAKRIRQRLICSSHSICSVYDTKLKWIYNHVSLCQVWQTLWIQNDTITTRFRVSVKHFMQKWFWWNLCRFKLNMFQGPRIYQSQWRLLIIQRMVFILAWNWILNQCSWPGMNFHRWNRLLLLEIRIGKRKLPAP